MTTQTPEPIDRLVPVASFFEEHADNGIGHAIHLGEVFLAVWIGAITLIDAKTFLIPLELPWLVGALGLVVHPAAGLPQLAKQRGARLVIINRDPTPLDGNADPSQPIRNNAGMMKERVARQLIQHRITNSST